jgi:ankyrin repeat protein
MVVKALAEGSDIDVSNENGWTGAMFAVAQVSRTKRLLLCLILMSIFSGDYVSAN